MSTEASSCGTTSLSSVVYSSVWLKKYQKDVRLNVFKCVRVISGVWGVDMRSVGVVGVGHADGGCDSSLQIKMFRLFCMFITSAHLGKFGLLRSNDSLFLI